MEVPEVTEFDVYLDIDGAVEEDEDDEQPGEGESIASYDTGDKQGQHPWQVYENGFTSGAATHSAAQLGLQATSAGQLGLQVSSVGSMGLQTSTLAHILQSTPAAGQIELQATPAGQIGSQPSSIAQILQGTPAGQIGSQQSSLAQILQGNPQGQIGLQQSSLAQILQGNPQGQIGLQQSSLAQILQGNHPSQIGLQQSSIAQILQGNPPGQMGLQQSSLAQILQGTSAGQMGLPANSVNPIGLQATSIAHILQANSVGQLGRQGGSGTGLWSVASTSGLSGRGNESDTEVDIDTPYSGILTGQTLIKSEPNSQESAEEVLARIVNYARMSSSFHSNPIEPTAKKKNAVAKKSTTQKKMTLGANKSGAAQKAQIGSNKKVVSKSATNKKVMNVAKKSTSKSSLPCTGVSAKDKVNKAKSGKVLQVKFGPGKFVSKPSSHVKAGHLFSSSSKMSMFKKPAQVAKKTIKSGVSGKVSAGNLPATDAKSKKKMKMFHCSERSGERIACPECSVVVKTYCLRAHLKTLHDLPLKICKKCRLAFTDVSLFSEHYALHLLKQEDSSPSKTKSDQLFKTGSYPSKKQKSKQSTSAVKTVSSDSPSVLSEATFPPESAPNKTGPPNKRPASPQHPAAPSPKLSKLSADIPSLSAALKQLPKLPPKPRKPSFHSKKNRSFLEPFNKSPQTQSERTDKAVFSPKASSVASASKKAPIPASKLPKLPPKPRKPFGSSKMKQLSPASAKSRNSAGIGHTDGYSSLDDSQCDDLYDSQPDIKKSVTSVKHQQRQASASSSSSWDLPPSKRSRQDVSTTATGSKKSSGKVTISLVSLETASKPYDCKVCLAAFNTALQCPKSFRQYSRDKPYSYSNCPAAFTHPEHLKTHQHLGCSVASVKTETGNFSSDFRRHRYTSAPSSKEVKTMADLSPGHNGLYGCPVCNETFMYRSLLLRHMPYHTCHYSCGICKKNFEEKMDLLNHMQIMHDGRMIVRCKYCEKRFENIEEYESHVATHKQGTVFTCAECNNKFSTSKEMHQHIQTFHGGSQSKSECKICGKSYKQENLAFHMKIVHKVIKPIVTKFISCRYCQKVFHRKQRLQSHYRSKHGLSLAHSISFANSQNVKPAPDFSEAPGAADQSKPACSTQSVKIASDMLRGKSTKCRICRKNFCSSKALLAHYRKIHHIEPFEGVVEPYSCHICRKLVYSSIGMKIHYKVVHKQRFPDWLKPVQQAKEPEPASSVASSEQKQSKNNKEEYSNPSTGEGPFRCNKCSKFFSHGWSYYRHQRLFHTKKVKSKGQAKPKPDTGDSSQPGNSDHAEDILKHAVTTKKKGSWVCPVCKTFFKARKKMRTHLKEQHPESYFDERCGSRKCKKCGKSFGNRLRSLVHMKTCGLKKNKINLGKKSGHKPTSLNKLGDFNCPMCDRVFKWKQNLIRHMFTNHQLSKAEVSYNMSFQKAAPSKEIIPHEFHLCKVCKICFTTRIGFQRHQQRRHKKKTGFFQCRYRSCKKTFTRNEGLFNHLKSAHPEMSAFWCRGCSAGFSTKAEVFSHACADKSQSSAPDMVYEDESSQQEEESMEREEEPCRYRCLECNMGFHIAQEWTRHMQHECPAGQQHTHQTLAPPPDFSMPKITTMSIFDIMSAKNTFMCHICNLVFSDENTLVSHTCTQSAQPVMPPVLPSEKKRDKRIKYQSEPVKCTVCLKLFSPLSIKRHMMSIHSLPIKTCGKCNIVFTDSEHFKKHGCHAQKEGDVDDVTRETFTDDDINEDSVTFFICQTCGGLFPDAGALEQHECPGEQTEEQEEHSEMAQPDVYNDEAEEQEKEQSSHTDFENVVSSSEVHLPAVNHTGMEEDRLDVISSSAENLVAWSDSNCLSETSQEDRNNVNAENGVQVHEEKNDSSQASSELETGASGEACRSMKQILTSDVNSTDDREEGEGIDAGLSQNTSLETMVTVNATHTSVPPPAQTTPESDSIDTDDQGPFVTENQEYFVTENQETFVTKYQRPFASDNKQPSSMGNQDPFPVGDQELSPLGNQEPSSTENQNPSLADNWKPFLTDNQEPCPMETQEHFHKSNETETHEDFSRLQGKQGFVPEDNLEREPREPMYSDPAQGVLESNYPAEALNHVANGSI